MEARVRISSYLDYGIDSSSYAAALTKPYSVLRRDADRVVAGLADSDAPRICPRCLGEFSLVLTVNQANRLRLRAEYHDVFDRCLSMICVWPALHNDDTLREALARNDALCSVPGHRAAPVKAADLPEATYNLLAGVIISALDTGDNPPTVRAAANKSFSDRAGRWPSRVDQLLPLGEEGTVMALLAFAETYSCAAPMIVLRQLVILARTLVWPILMAGPNRRRFLFLIVTLLAPVLRKNPPYWLSKEEDTLKFVVGFLSNIRAGPDGVTRERKQFVGGDAEILYEAVVFCINRVPNSFKMFPELAVWCLMLHHRLPAGKASPPPRVLRWKHEFEKKTKPSLGLAMHLALSRIAQLRACSFCGTSSLKNDGGKALPACAGCKLMRYCSRLCQKQHWNLTGGGDRVAHKAICPILRRLDVSVYASGEPEEFAEAFRIVEPEFTAEEKETLKDWISEVWRALGEAPLDFDQFKNIDS